MAANEAGSTALLDQVVNVSDFIWGGEWQGEQILQIGGIPVPPMTVILLGIGLWMMFGLRFYPIRKFGAAVGGLFKGRKGAGSGEISPFAALSTALSGQVGTGNLAGVAFAIAWGGPGAVFWMWVTALIGMALAFAEGSLAIRYRETTSDGVKRGGPMSYIMLGLGPKYTWLAIVFCIGTLFSALVTGNSIQSNEVATGLKELFGIERWVGGLVVATAVFVVIIGGIKSIGNVAEKVVPVMAAAYVLLAIIALILNAGDLPETFGRIFAGAFNNQAAEGGFIGAAIIIAIRAGVARGLFSNEAGQGSTPIAHAVAQTDDPEQQGRMAMLGTFIDTIVICTMTALVILTVQGDFEGKGQPVEHVWQSDLSTVETAGVATTIASYDAAFPATIGDSTGMERATGELVVVDGAMTEQFSAWDTLWNGVFFSSLGTLVVSVALILFVFTTLLTWSYYGERAITFIYDRVPGSTRGGEKILHIIWRVIWCVAIFVGATQPSQLVWRLGDISNAAMALPNLLALALLSGVVFKLARGEKSAGRDYGKETPEEPEEY